MLNTMLAESTHIEQINAALALPNFDTHLAKLTMGMAGRLAERPASKSGEARIGAVMLLLYPIDGVLHIVYTKRPDSLRDHSGQISFPGGRRDEGETLETTALRELWEEVGVSAESVTLLGCLSQMYILPSDFMVYPYVGFVSQRPNFVLNSAEVEILIEAPLPTLLDPDTRHEEVWTFKRFNNAKMNVPYFLVNGYKIWGATAIITAEFLERWKKAVGEPTG